MAGTKAGGVKARVKNLASDPDYYKNIGSKGGTAPHSKPRGFASVPREKRIEAGRLGGSRSRLQYKKGV